MSEEAKLDRRGFLAGAAGLTGVALSVGAWKPVFAMETATESIEPGGRNFKISTIALTLGGQTAGSLAEAEGGSAFTEVIETEPSASKQHIIQKLPGRLKWSTITLKQGITMDKPYFDWISTAIAGQPQALNGTIAGADESFTIISQTDFFNALITEVGFPALDAASKDTFKMTVKFQPEFTRTAKSGGKVQRFNFSNGWPSKISIGSFKLTINGMDTAGVSKIDALNIKLNYTTPEDVKVGTPQLSTVDIPNMKVTVAQARAQDFVKWHTDFVIQGNDGVENYKTGSLAFVSSDQKTELFRLDLAGVGIFALEPDPLVAGQSELNTTAQLFVNDMKFTVKL